MAVAAKESNKDGGRLNDLAQIVGAYNEVTERLERSHKALQERVIGLQRELASTNAQLQRSKRLAALGEMAAGIAHEIRNPLGAIQLYAGMLVEDLTDLRLVEVDRQGLAEVANKIAAGVRGLNGIVEDVLSFSRDISPKPVVLGVGRLFDRAVEVCQPALTAAGVVVSRHDRLNRGGDDLAVRGDAELLHQALLNLIRNGIDAAASGDKEGVVGLDARREGGQVVLVVRDNGAGIVEENIDRIFNPFFTTRNTGTGLGLAIVHRIVDAHGGTVGVHNDGGAVFELSLPVEVGLAKGSGGHAGVERLSGVGEPVGGVLAGSGSG